MHFWHDNKNLLILAFIFYIFKTKYLSIEVSCSKELWFSNDSTICLPLVLWKLSCSCSLVFWLLRNTQLTAQKMKFSIKDFFSKCDQIRSFCHIYWRNPQRKNFIFYAQFDKSIIFPLLVFETLRFILTVLFQHFKQNDSIVLWLQQI